MKHTTIDITKLKHKINERMYENGIICQFAKGKREKKNNFGNHFE